MRRAVVVVDAVAVEVGGDEGDVGAAAPLPLSPLLPPTPSPLRGCQFVCSVHCKHVGAGAGLSLCSALCTIGASHARAGSGARISGIRDELRTSRVVAGGAIGPAVASVGGAAIAPRAIRGQGLRFNVDTVLAHFSIPAVSTPSPEVVLGHCVNSGPRVVLGQC